MGLFDPFGDFFTLVFSKDPVEIRTRRELRTIRSYLKTVKPAVYKASGNLVLPGFASSVHGFAVALKPIRDLLERSYLSADPRIARRFRELLIERRLEPGALKLLESCSYEAMKARAGADFAGADAAAAAAAEDFRAFRKNFEGPAAAAMEAELAEFDRLADLCRFDFSRMLAQFDSSVKMDASYKPRFSAAHGPALAGELADIHSIVAIPAFGPAVLGDLVAVAERVGGEDGSESKKRFSRALAAAARSLSSNISAPVLAALQRAVREDPRFVPPAAAPVRAFLPEFRDLAEKRFREDRDRLVRESRDRSLNTEIAVLFGGAEGAPFTLSSVTGYDEALDARLKAEASRSFAWMTPLTLMKNFDQRCLSQGFLEAARRLAVEGFFNNGAVRSRLTDTIARLEKSGSRIAAFEESAAGPGRTGAAALRKLLAEGSTGKDVSDAVERLVKGLDERAKDMVERDVAACRVLAEIVYDVIGDFRKPMPELVTNIKTLAASKSKNLIPTLADGYNSIARLLKIMKAYVLVTPIN